MAAATTTPTTPAKGGGRPNRYATVDGKRVPGVTTIIGRFKESGGLIHWAWNLGMEGQDYRQVRDNAGNAGTLAHALIDADIHGANADAIPDAHALKMDALEYDVALDRARTALGAFKQWRATVNLDVIVTELPLVSEKHRFAGTLDAVARVDGKLGLFDWKTSAKIYPDYLVQVSAYRALWEEHHPDQPIETMHLVRVDKEFAGFTHMSWPLAMLDTGWAAFQHMRALYDLDSVLKKATG